MKRALCYGDSNTYGYDPRDIFDDCYPPEVRWTDRLSRALTGKWEIIAEGMNGRCLPQLPLMEGYLRSLLENSQPLHRFVVMLGTNDLLQVHHPDAAAAALRMEALLNFLRTQYPAVERMVIAPPVPFEGLGGSWFAHCQREGRELTRRYRNLAERYDAIFADAGAWKIPMADDYVHFSDAGHVRFAKKMEDFFADDILL